MAEPISLSAIFTSIASYIKVILPTVLKFLGILWIGEKLAILTSGSSSKPGVVIDMGSIFNVFMQIFPMFMTIFMVKWMMDLMRSFMTEIARTVSEKPSGVM